MCEGSGVNGTQACPDKQQANIIHLTCMQPFGDKDLGARLHHAISTAAHACNASQSSGGHVVGAVGITASAISFWLQSMTAWTLQSNDRHSVAYHGDNIPDQPRATQLRLALCSPQPSHQSSTMRQGMHQGVILLAQCPHRS